MSHFTVDLSDNAKRKTERLMLEAFRNVVREEIFRNCQTIARENGQRVAVRTVKNAPSEFSKRTIIRADAEFNRVKQKYKEIVEGIK